MKLFYNQIFKNYILIFSSFLISEIIFRLIIKVSLFDWSILRIIVGINLISLVLSLLYSFFGRIVSNILCVITSLIANIYAVAQVGFYNYIGVFMSFGSSTQAGAVKDYFSDYLASFKLSYIFFLVPPILILLFIIFIDPKIKIAKTNEQIDFADKFDSQERKQINEKNAIKKEKNGVFANRVSSVILIFITLFIYYLTITIPFMQNKFQLKTNAELLKNPDMPNISISQLGYNIFVLTDIKNILLPAKTTITPTEYEDTYHKLEQKQTDYTRKIDDTVWEKIANTEKNKNYKTLNNYFISQEITDKNDYTGIFRDKNLIVIMMESVNNIAINKKYYPNLYKLYSEGWSWDNAYSPRNNCSTGNNELSGMTSLYTINNNCTSNIYKNNTYPYSLFNLFNNAGYKTSSYHNYTEQYYARSSIHKNAGSNHYYGVQELGIPYSNLYEEWPSDVDLMEKFLKLTNSEEKYMAWITTVSSHQPYTSKSELGDKYISIFADTAYDTSLKRYMSKLKVLDDAIGVLVDGLERQGKLEDTVIVLYGDHYPYGLSTKTLNSYFDYDVTKNLEVDKTPFIIYNSEITPTKFNEYTSYMNITPTIANLFNLDYDPRYYAGKDILSKSYENRVIFADGSWQDNKCFYNATTGKIKYNNEGATYTTEQIKEINQSVKNRITMSNLAIKTNYFNYLEKKFKDYKVDNIDLDIDN